MIRRAWLIVVIVAFAVVFAVVWRPLIMNNSEGLDRPIINVKTRIFDKTIDYLRNNSLSFNENRFRDRNTRDHLADYLVARASDHYPDDPGGIVLTYDADQCAITLPAGRQFKFGYVGPLIEDIEAIFPLEPMAWDDMQEMIQDIVGQFEDAGWTYYNIYSVDRPAKLRPTPADFLRIQSGTKWVHIGNWVSCDTPWVQANIEVRHYNSSSAGSFMPPAALSPALPDDAPDRFLMLIWFHIADDAVTDEMRALRDARRLSVNGNVHDPVPVSIWLDDPDWRPDGWNGTYVE